MIHVDRSIIPRPACLDGPESPGGKERQKAIDHYLKPEHAAYDPDIEFSTYKAYKLDEVKNALEMLFHRKCAYCESRYVVNHPVDIEHYRPKAAVKITKKQTLRGYYWLAADWDNLLPSCIDCNRARMHDHFEELARTSGKANAFPLARESKRARQPGEESNEEPLLLNPCVDDPEKHLEFLKEGNIRACRISKRKNSPKGLTSIEIYGLRRKDLVEERHIKLKVMYGEIHVMVFARLSAPDHPEIYTMLLKNLENFCGPDSEYLAMTRQLMVYVNAVLAQIEKLDALRKAEPFDAAQFRQEAKALKALLDPDQPFGDLGQILDGLITEWIEEVF